MAEMAEVLVLSQDDCALCEHAHAVLNRVGRDFPLAVAELDLASAEGQKLAAAGGILFAPGIFIDGQPFSYGRLSERKLRRELGRGAGGRPAS